MKNKKLIAIIAVVAVLILLAITIILVVVLNNKQQENSVTPTESPINEISDQPLNTPEVTIPTDNPENIDNADVKTEDEINPDESEEPVVEVYETPDPNRFNGGMAMTPEEIAEITNSEEYKKAVNEEILYTELTMNRETESSGSQFYLNSKVATIPTYSADEWLWLSERCISIHYYPDKEAPEYKTIEIYNYAETKTNFIVFIGEDSNEDMHVEIVCMYEDAYGAIEFDYVGSSIELYEYMKEKSDRITENDIIIK